MARSRNIKPGFFKNDLLAEIEPLGRLLFAGLWTIADREGRLKYRPKRIKAEVLPYDLASVEGLLTELESKGFILIYEVGGCDYIQILNFLKHQNPHKNEQPSEIPPPAEYYTSTVQVPELHSTNPADSLNPITDSLYTDSLSSDAPPPDATTSEREMLSVLKSVEGYPIDYKKDLDMLRTFTIDYPKVNMLFELKKWRDYKRDKPLKENSSPRSQLRSWMQKAKPDNAKGGEQNGRNFDHLYDQDL